MRLVINADNKAIMTVESSTTRIAAPDTHTIFEGTQAEIDQYISDNDIDTTGLEDD